MGVPHFIIHFTGIFQYKPSLFGPLPTMETLIIPHHPSAGAAGAWLPMHKEQPGISVRAPALP
jgi:hypothetical protein